MKQQQTAKPLNEKKEGVATKRNDSLPVDVYKHSEKPLLCRFGLHKMRRFRTVYGKIDWACKRCELE